MGGGTIPTFCPLCVSRCGARATGKAICLKGKAAPDIVSHSSRLLHPMRRTRPKGAADPGWEQITWDEALGTVAERLQAAAAAGGAEAVVFSSSSPDPQVELHPSAAETRGIAAGDWVSIDTPHGSIRARAKLNPSLDPGVVFAQHGWWEACEELGLPGYPAYGPDSANLNLVLRQTPSDPISGSSPLRASVCDLALLP